MNNLNPAELVPQEARRPIPGYQGKYEIDVYGNVYAMVAYRSLPSGRVMKLRPHKGYISVMLYKDGKEHGRYVHRLVMLTFQPIENAHLFEVNHEDGNKANNRLDNLKWMTHQANIHHARSVLGINRDQRGDNAGYRKLTSEIVREIRRLYASGMKQKDIAVIYSVTQHAISDVIARRSWASVD